MAAKTEAALGVKPQLILGSQGIFDVILDNNLVYSKHKTHSFPDENKLVDELRATLGKQ